MGDWRNRIVRYGEQSADQFTAHPENPRRHPQAQRDAVKGSLDTLGWIAPVIVNKRTGYMIDGHERIFQALAQGDETPVPFIEIDLSEDEERLALASFDWITQMAVYDRDSLNTLLQQVNTDEPALQALLSELAMQNGIVPADDTPPGDPGAAIDRATELRDKFGVERGQVWVVGRHRVMCGDAYSTADRARLLRGAMPDMLHIDPPYGINIVKPSNDATSATVGGAKAFGSTGETKRKGASAVAERNSADNRAARVHVQHGKPSKNQWSKTHPEHLVIKGDTRVGSANTTDARGAIIQSNLYPVIEGDDRPFDPSAFLALAPIVIMWGANYYADKLPARACWICWDKREDITRNNFADGELAWTNQNSPMRIFYHLWNGLHKGSQHGERRTHPTEKPVALFAEIGKMYADGGIWMDVFAGTGAQVVAAEQTGATCYANEIEPLYVAVILQRLTDMGLTPQLEA